MSKSANSLLLRQKRRLIVDHLARYGVAFGGISVIIAITLIFFYLAWVVFPLFGSAHITAAGSYPVPGSSSKTLFLGMEEQAEIGVRVSQDGEILFFKTATGERVDSFEIEIPLGQEITSFAMADPASAVLAIGFSDGSVQLVKYTFGVSYPDNKRVLTPRLENVLGPDPVGLDPRGNATKLVSAQVSEDSVTVVAVSDDNHINLSYFAKESSFLDDEVHFEQTDVAIENPMGEISFVLMNKEQRRLYLISQSGDFLFFNISNKDQPILVQKGRLSQGQEKISDVQFLAATISLLVSYDNGTVSQWFPVRGNDNDFSLTRVRSFESPKGGSYRLVAEHFRKAFVITSGDGHVSFQHATAQRELISEKIVDGNIVMAGIAPRANFLLVLDDKQTISAFHVENEHPEVSWSSLWGKVWYEGYEEPDYIWQSSSASNDFEPKLSLVPLSFGTLKAAFYAMLLAMPLAILGAIYTAYFMSPKLRQSVKPTIEIMEALPTVILGFLAGLWLAPLLEEYLPGVFSLVVILPIGIILFAYGWTKLPSSIKHRVPEGWQPILILPVVILISWFAISISPILEATLFGGNMPLWLRDEMGINFDQRNSLVVGLAMGFAVIPTIFSIAEDAIFSVPKHLTNGSLALGATPWQTFARVVLLTASPGIFSAVMIGFGRAVGETMIVLMATGNTPVLDFSIFQGMRTLSANIAVEMPESEVASTHFRVLFLAALVLFVFTFMFNTLAEVVRQRLRKKYSSL